jgi:hypothetical protein
MNNGFTKEQRADILARRTLAAADHQRVKKEVFAKLPLTDESRSRLRAADAFVKRTEEEYRAGLPVVVMSTCPYCGRPLERTFDPFDLDGEWWKGIRPAGPEPCSHYAFLKGAVHVGSARPPNCPEDGVALAGPEMPYVIPKLLEQPTVVAVIGELPMEPGWTAYPIAYFATQRPPPRGLSGDWALASYNYKDPLTGQSQFRMANEKWDFDLAPWIARDKLRWCTPGSSNRALADAKKDRCPYLGLPGQQRQLRLEPGGAQRIPPPDGMAIDPIGER